MSFKVNDLINKINAAETESEMKKIETLLIDMVEAGEIAEEEYRRLDSLYYNRYLREFNN